MKSNGARLAEKRPRTQCSDMIIANQQTYVKILVFIPADLPIATMDSAFGPSATLEDMIERQLADQERNKIRAAYHRRNSGSAQVVLAPCPARYPPILSIP
jgi:hypothetical protein